MEEWAWYSACYSSVYLLTYYMYCFFKKKTLTHTSYYPCTNFFICITNNKRLKFFILRVIIMQRLYAKGWTVQPDLIRYCLLQKYLKCVLIHHNCCTIRDQQWRPLVKCSWIVYHRIPPFCLFRYQLTPTFQHGGRLVPVSLRYSLKKFLLPLELETKLIK